MLRGKVSEKDLFDKADLDRRRAYVKAQEEFLNLMANPEFQAKFKRLPMGDKRYVQQYIKRLLDSFGKPETYVDGIAQLQRLIDASGPAQLTGSHVGDRRSY